MKKYIYKYDIPQDVFDSLLQKNITMISIDTEALGLDINRDRLCVVQMMINKDVYIVHFPKPNYESKNLKQLLGDSKIQKLFHFARFDMFIIYKYLGVLMKNIVCTRVLSKIVRTYSDRHGLKELCRELLKYDMNKGAQSSNWAIEDLTQSQIDYAANDVIYLPDLFDILKTMAEKEKRYSIAQDMFDILPSIIRIENSLFNPVDLIDH